MKKPDWLARIGVDRNGVKLVGQVRGMITLTRDDDGVHTLWILDYALLTGNAVTVRAEYQRYDPAYLD